VSLTYTLEVNAPIEKAFDLVDDKEKLKWWMDGLVDTVYTSDYNPNQPVGTRFKQRIKEGGRIAEYDGEVIAYEKPRHFAVRLGNKHFSVDVHYRFTPLEAGTRLDYACDIHFNATWMRILGFLFGWLNRLILRKQMRKFKAVAERADLQVGSQ
jgi:uncharacterized protein YndB with AHSA1/START domain